MGIETDTRVTVKLFIGYEFTSEIKMYLSNSPKWKQDALISNKTHEHLQQVKYQEKEYIGSYLADQSLPMNDLCKSSLSIKEKLVEYCPEINTKTLKTSIFPQVFVA